MHIVSPVTATGLAPGYRVTHVVAGECLDGLPGSESIAGAVYRCFAGNFIEDPCWRDPRAADRKDVVCLLEPWQHSLTEIRLSAPLAPARESLALSRSDPWGIELADGRRCLLLQGAHDTLGPPATGRVLSWSCNQKTAVLEGLHQSEQPWTADTAIYVSTPPYTKAGPLRVPIAVAWYGVDGPAALAGLPFTGFPVWPLLAVGFALLGLGTIALRAGSR